MSKTLLTGAFAALMILLSASIATAQQAAETPKAKKPTQSIAELEQASYKAYQEKNWVRLYAHNMKLHQQRPYTPEYMINIIIAAASLDRKQTAYHFMLQMQQQGLAYDLDDYPETEGIRETEAYDYMHKLMVEAGEPRGEGAKQFDLDVKTADLGDVAWDSSRERFVVGTRSDGRLLAVDDAGKTEVLLKANEENGLWSIDGVAVDAGNKRLWIASNATPDFAGFTPADANRGGLFEFDLDTLEPVGQYNLPVDSLRHSLGSIAVTSDGTVYVIDRATPIIYRKAVSVDRLESFAGGPQLVALTDITVTPDNSRIFVADAVLGVLLIDPKVQRSAMLTGPDTLNLGGIYGIEFADKNLVITQSGIMPQRIVRLELNADGASVANVAPMASALESFDTPGAGTLRDSSLYYFANHGSATAGQDLVLMATPLDAGSNVEPPDMKVFNEAVRQAAEKAAKQKQ